jgi:hypothetical protein
MTSRPPVPLVIQAIDAWRDRLQVQEAAALRAMTRNWANVEERLQAKMLELAAYLDEQRALGIDITPARLMQMDRYRDLISQARAEQMRYAATTAEAIGNGQEAAIRQGLQMAADTIAAAAQDAGLRNLVFNRLNVDAVNYAIGFAADGTPLNDLLRTSYPDSVLRLTDAIVTGLASGEGPRATAARMADAMAGNLDRALTIARTEQLRALRTANLAQMAASEVVEGYVRRAQLAGNVCPACLALSGTFYRTEAAAAFDAHPNCACYAQPILKFGPTPTFPTGPEWFDTLPESQQRAMLGPGRYALYADGRLDWQRVATVHDDPTWGATIKLTAIEDLSKATIASAISFPAERISSGGFVSDGGSVYVRYTDNPNRVMSRWGHAMFADNPGPVEGVYGDNAWVFDASRYTNGVYDEERLRPILEKEIDELIERGYGNTEGEDYLIREFNDGNIDKDFIINQYFPQDIVTGAMGYDSPEYIDFIEGVADRNDIAAIITPDGAVVFNENLIQRAPDFDYKEKGEFFAGKENANDKASKEAENEYLDFLADMKQKYGDNLYRDMTDSELEKLEELERKYHIK